MVNICKITKKCGSAIFINTNNLKKNYLLLQKIVSPSKVAAVVKSNAYGIGAEKITQVLTEVNCKDFFVATLDEALLVRKVSKKSNIYVLHGIFFNTEDMFIEYNLTPVINSISQLKKWLQYAKYKGKKLSCIIHVDTGINRLGLTKVEVEHALSTFTDLSSCLNIEYIMSHLACSSDSNNDFNNVQLNCFINISKLFNKHKCSLASSYGIFLGKEFHFDLVRPGFSLYGSNPTPSKTNPLLPVIEFYSTILKINTIKKGGRIGYNHLWIAKKDSLVATVSVGYSDGIFINYKKNSGLYINNQKVQLIGRVSMDSLVVDISHLQTPVKEGDIVEVIGKNQDIDDFAEMNLTINCQALNILSLRYPRIYY